MKNMKWLGIFWCAFLFASCQTSDYFKDAVAAWSFAELDHDENPLKVYGDVLIVNLSGDEAKASKARGGDGKAIQFNGGWLDAGQGTGDKLNLQGKNITILVRAKANQVEGYTPVVNKSGNDQNIAYSISYDKIEGDVYIRSLMGSDEIAGAHLLQYKLPENEINSWHDIVLRFNGEISELYVDGQLRDDEVTVGEIRNWNRRPLLIGAQFKKPFGYAEPSEDQIETKFDGMIDHVVLWNRHLSDDEIIKISGVDEIKDGKPAYYSEKYRPQFHFSAKKNWLNDPNGLVYYDGVYHLFFQYRPSNRSDAYKDWGHAVSTDLVHWEQIPHHITPHKVWSGCWSGSAVVDVNNSAGFQTGEEKTIVAFLTNGGDPGRGLGPLCTQCIAYSNDGGKTFTYYDQNPVIRHIMHSNRDPKVVWDEASQKWIMSLYMDSWYDFGIFSSTNLKEWKHESTSSIEGVRECPGFEPLPLDGDKNNKKWMFFGANGDYVIGSFDGTNFKSETKVLRGDYGMNYYAAQTWSDTPDGRCIIIAWMPTQRYPGMPFQQQMNFPSELTLKTTSEGMKAFRMPVREIEKLYDKEYKWDNKTIKDSKLTLNELNGDLYDMDMEIDVSKSSSLQIGLRNITITYDTGKKILSCGGDGIKGGIIPETWLSGEKDGINSTNNMGHAPLSPTDGKIKLRILLDRNTVEIFGNDGEIVLTSCFMPKDDNLTYSVKAEGEINMIKAGAHSLKSAWTN